MTKKLLIIVLSILFSCQIFAQETKITISAPESVGTGIGFRIIYTINSTGGKFQQPVFDDSFSVSGPQTSSSHSSQWINGDFSSVSTTTYLYYLVAEKEGTFTIPPAKYIEKNKTTSSSSVTITVAKSAPQSSAAGTQASSNEQRSSGGEEVYLRLLTNTKDVYVGQPVEASLKLYTRIQISSLGNGIAYPDFKGFLKENVKTAPLQSLDIETINGVEYGTGSVEKFLLYPQIPGDITIDRAQMQVLVKQKSDFDDFFGSSVFSSSMTVPRTISSTPLTIHVRALPSPKPSDFYGAVGKFEMTSSLSKETIQANDALTFTIKISGSGNINIAGTPRFDVPATVEKYDPKVTVSATGTNGSKTFEYLLIPRHSGEFVIPEVTYSYFDVNTGIYVTLRTESHKVNVLQGGNTSEAEAPVISASKEDVKYLGQDIRFIKTNDYRLRMKSNAMIESSSYFLLYILSLAIAVCLFVVFRQLRHRNADINLSRNRKAARVAKKRLKNAEENLNAKKYELMHEEIAKALGGYLSDKLLIPLSDLTRDKCFTMLGEKGIQPDTITELDTILSSCEYSRYAPSSASESPEALFKRTEKLLSSLENLL